MQNLSGRTIMIVEDDFFAAAELSDHFTAVNARVLGPYPTVSAAMNGAGKADLAVLDLNLRDEKVYPVADKLMRQATPFVFYSAQNLASIPARFSHIAKLQKPLEVQQAVEILDRSFFEVSVTALLPRLRLSARLIIADPLAADRLVEATLQMAIADHRKFDEIPPLAEWLNDLMIKALDERGRDFMN